jgi:glycosyltransferase involved in cell wall biosynthesis
MRANKAIYASSYDRGLQTLLELWPAVHEQVPDATLDIYYGWNVFDDVFSQNPEKMRWKWGIIRMLNDLKDKGVTEHGRITHEELAEKFKQSKVWAYPTEFNEINCITALKAQEAGCIPVTTGCYALAETVINNRYTVECKDISTNTQKRQEFIDNMVKALKSNDEVRKVPKVYWEDIAKQWDEVMA